MVRKILVPVDGSEYVYKAIDFAANLAKQYGATIHLLHVAKLTKTPKGLEDYMRAEGIREAPDTFYLQIVGNQIIVAAEDEAKKKGVEHIETTVIPGDPAERIISFAKEGGFDMIVMGSRGLGSVSSKVCREVNLTCVIARKTLLDGKRILAVDDEPDVLETLVELLSMCDVIKASTFDEAKELLETQYFDMAILDIMGVNGYELLRIANKKKVLPVMLTAHALSLDDTIKSFKEGAASYVPKDRMFDIATYLTDVLEAKEKGKHFWWRWFDRFGSFYHKRFGADLPIREKES